MKKTTAVIICVLFFGVLLLPGALLPLTGDEPIGNIPLAQMPELIVEDTLNLQFPAQMEDYFQDRFFGRADLIGVYSTITGNVFGVSSSDTVIWGEDGWLFFGETVGDYEGSSTFDEEQSAKIVRTLEMINEEIIGRGGEFLLAVAPNKNTLYGEYMPDNYVKNEGTSNYDIVLTGNYASVDLATAFNEQDRELYFKTDSHWNGEGARLAAGVIMEKIEEMTGEAVHFDWQGVEPEATTKEGDLAVMLYPADTPLEADVMYADAEQEFSGRIRSPEEMNITTTSDGAPLNVFMMRDSFTNSLINYFSNGYEQMHYTRIMPLPLEMSEAHEADVYVLEIVERRLPELLLSAPSMYAEETETFDISGALQGGSIFVEEGRLYGVVPELGAEISVMIVTSEGELAYEAFPIVEEVKLAQQGMDFVGMDGFSLLLQNPPEGEFETYVTNGEHVYKF